MRVIKLNKSSFEEKEIKGDLKSLQSEVGGPITIPFMHEELSARNIDIVADDEGLLKPDPKPTLLFLNNGEIINCLYGPILFVGIDHSTGETISLNDEQIAYIKKNLQLLLYSNKENKTLKCFGFSGGNKQNE